MAAGLANVERLRQELVMNVSHDLRTPLTIIKGYLDGLLNGQIADRRSAEEAFGAMETEVNHLLHLVHDLNQVAALDGGQTPLNKEPLKLERLIAEVVVRARPLATEKQVRLVQETAADLPSLVADRVQIGQMLFNLVENGIRHTPEEGMVKITAAVENGMMRLVVSDTGEGIPAVHQPRIFERFYRVDASRHGQEAGSGLGLAIVKGMVEAQ